MGPSVPSEVIEYLKTHRRFDFDSSKSECGDVLLVSADSLSAREFWVDGEDRGWVNDPHEGELGYYVFSGVDLVSQIDGFEPAGVLVWMPDLNSFGTWDSDHWDLIVFTDTQWKEIVANPVKYLDAQWDPSCPFEYFQPWTAGLEWRKGRPAEVR